MKMCTRVKRILPLAAEGDIGPQELREVREHLKTCQVCFLEHSQFSRLAAIARQVIDQEVELPAAVRFRIAAEAAEKASRQPWTLPIPLFALPPRPAILTLAVALLVGLLGFHAFFRPLGTHAGPEVGVTKIEVVAEGGVVRLAWSDGMRSSYRVLKSDDPRFFQQRDARVVWGNVWIDTDPGSSAIVFYKIE